MDNRRFALCHARFFVAQMPETALRIYQKKEDTQYETQEKVETRRPSQIARHGGKGQPQAEREK